MTSDYIPLTALERDALTELVNIGVSRAAAGLRKMVGEEVLLSVSSIEVVAHKSAVTLIGERESDDLVAVRQDFAGPFSGRTLLIFPRAKSLDLVHAVAGEDMKEKRLRNRTGGAQRNRQHPPHLLPIDDGQYVEAILHNVAARSVARERSDIIRGYFAQRE
jgi:hypothetical protein